MARCGRSVDRLTERLGRIELIRRATLLRANSDQSDHGKSSRSQRERRAGTDWPRSAGWGPSEKSTDGPSASAMRSATESPTNWAYARCDGHTARNDSMPNFSSLAGTGWATAEVSRAASTGCWVRRAT